MIFYICNKIHTFKASSGVKNTVLDAVEHYCSALRHYAHGDTFAERILNRDNFAGRILNDNTYINHGKSACRSGEFVVFPTAGIGIFIENIQYAI